MGYVQNNISIVGWMMPYNIKEKLNSEQKQMVKNTIWIT